MGFVRFAPTTPVAKDMWKMPSRTCRPRLIPLQPKQRIKIGGLDQQLRPRPDNRGSPPNWGQRRIEQGAIRVNGLLLTTIQNAALSECPGIGRAEWNLTVRVLFTPTLFVEQWHICNRGV